MGFRVWGLGFGVWDFGFGVQGLTFRVWGLGFGVLIFGLATRTTYGGKVGRSMPFRALTSLGDVNPEP